MGFDGSHRSAGDFPPKCILAIEFAPTGYQKKDNLRPSDGVHEWRRDIEYGMVPVHEFDDIEYRSFHWSRRVVGHRDGAGDPGVEGVETFLRREGWRSAWEDAFFCCFSWRRGCEGSGSLGRSLRMFTVVRLHIECYQRPRRRACIQVARQSNDGRAHEQVGTHRHHLPTLVWREKRAGWEATISSTRGVCLVHGIR